MRVISEYNIMDMLFVSEKLWWSRPILRTFHSMKQLKQL